MTSIRPAVVGCCALALVAPAVARNETQPSARTNAATPLVGTWALVSYESSEADASAAGSIEHCELMAERQDLEM